MWVGPNPNVMWLIFSIKNGAMSQGNHVAGGKAKGWHREKGPSERQQGECLGEIFLPSTLSQTSWL